jgi:hypothetical protein
MPLRRGARNPACRVEAPSGTVTKLSSHRGAGILAARVGIRVGVLILRCAPRRMSRLRDTLTRRVAEDRRDGFAPFMVVATAATRAAGAIDPLPDLARFCRSEDLWVSCRCTWGGGVISPHLRGRLAGIGDADSIACGAHKWFSVPMGAGRFFCRYPDAVGPAFRADALLHAQKTGLVLDPYAASVQWSRQYDALPLVCFTRDGLVTSKFLAALFERQIAWMSEVRFGDSAPVVRAYITSFRTAVAISG